MFTQEHKDKISANMKSLWADPVYRAKQSALIRKPPKCPECGDTDIANFYVDKDNRRSVKKCKECHKKKSNERWHAKTYFEKRAYTVKRYGITGEQFEEMYKAQDGKCKICNIKSNAKRTLHIDHCHETGKIRGLLCHGCNTALGAFKEDPDLLMKAIEYLRSFKT